MTTSRTVSPCIGAAAATAGRVRTRRAVEGAETDLPRVTNDGRADFDADAS
jgi:hypothetical protein